MMFLYAGPDQVMAIASGLATVVGFLLMCWNRILGLCGRLLNARKSFFHEGTSLREKPNE